MATTAKPPFGASDEHAADQPLRILVVEDDPAALAATVDMLEALGHWTAGVKSAEVARDRFLDGAFDVLMTDVGLPALSGLDLVEILQADEKLKVIFATGRPRPAQPPIGSIWLQKPFGIDELMAVLQGIRRGG